MMRKKGNHHWATGRKSSLIAVMFIGDRNDGWLQKVKVEVWTLLGLGSDEEAYITLKEIPTIQMLELKDS